MDMIYRKCDYRIVHNEKIFVGFTCASIMMSIWCCLDIYWCKQNLGMTQIALAGFLKAIHCHSYIKSTSVWCRFDVGLALGCSKELGPDVNTILHYILLIYQVDNNTLFKLLNELKLYSIQSSMQYNTLFKLLNELKLYSIQSSVQYKSFTQCNLLMQCKSYLQC